MISGDTLERERKSSEKFWERKNLLQYWRAELLATSSRQSCLSAGGGEAATPDTVSLIGLADCACTEHGIKTHMFLSLMTLFHNQVLGCIFFFLVNLWLMKISRLAAEETDFINNTQNPCRRSPEYYNWLIQAFMFHTINCIDVK